MVGRGSPGFSAQRESSEGEFISFPCGFLGAVSEAVVTAMTRGHPLGAGGFTAAPGAGVSAICGSLSPVLCRAPRETANSCLTK